MWIFKLSVSVAVFDLVRGTFVCISSVLRITSTHGGEKKIVVQLPPPRPKQR